MIGKVSDLIDLAAVKLLASAGAAMATAELVFLPYLQAAAYVVVIVCGLVVLVRPSLHKADVDRLSDKLDARTSEIFAAVNKIESEIATVRAEVANLKGRLGKD